MKRLVAILTMAGLCGCAAFGPPASTAPATPVFFSPFSADLDDSALSAIQSAAKQAIAQPDAPVYVTGAADSVGSKRANKYLSETRAQVVADQLAADGVDESRILVKGVGMLTPKFVPTGTPTQGARRVLIQVGG